jgi:threonine dehydrogenase-like Zn-dependent dehydrogenase
VRKAVWQGNGRVTFVQDAEKRPPPGDPHEVRVRVTAAGVCGTDVHIIGSSEESVGECRLGQLSK